MRTSSWKHAYRKAADELEAEAPTAHNQVDSAWHEGFRAAIAWSAGYLKGRTEDKQAMRSLNEHLDRTD